MDFGYTTTTSTLDCMTQSHAAMDLTAALLHLSYSMGKYDFLNIVHIKHKSGEPFLQVTLDIFRDPLVIICTI